MPPRQFRHRFTIKEDYDRFEDYTFVRLEPAAIDEYLSLGAYFIRYRERDAPLTSVRFGISSVYPEQRFNEFRTLKMLIDGGRHVVGEMDYDFDFVDGDVNGVHVASDEH